MVSLRSLNHPVVRVRLHAEPERHGLKVKDTHRWAGGFIRPRSGVQSLLNV